MLEVGGFREPQTQEQLRRLLTAVAFHNPGGYSQAMNFVIGLIMIQLREAQGVREGDIFWLGMVVFRLLPGKMHTIYIFEESRRLSRQGIMIDNSVEHKRIREC